MKAPVYSKSGKKKGEVSLKKDIFGLKPNQQAVHQSVISFLASQRRGTASSKTRSEARGGGAKPWRQKGTGRARAGSIRSPLWKGGGVTFGPKPRDFSVKVPKKVKKLALKSALSYKAKEGKILILGEKDIEPKTRKATEIVGKLKIKGKFTLVIKEGQENFALAFRNLPQAGVVYVDELNAYFVLDNKQLILTQEAFDYLQEVI